MEFWDSLGHIIYHMTLTWLLYFKKGIPDLFVYALYSFSFQNHYLTSKLEKLSVQAYSTHTL